MSLTEKQLRAALDESMKRLATKQDLDRFATKEDVEEVLRAVNAGFDAITGQVHRIERIVDSWPAPSTILNLLDRVAKLEQDQKLITRKVGDSPV